MAIEPLIFDAEFMRTAAASPRHAAPLLHRLATAPDGHGKAFCDQLERAALFIPANQRARALGSLKGSASDDQVRAAIGTLLLAKTLQDNSWSTELEPVVEGRKTPDMRITKGETSHLVEVRRIESAFLSAEDVAIARISDQLAGLKETTTPISILRATVDGRASLKRFVRYVRDALTVAQQGQGQREHHFTDPGVSISFRIETFSNPHPVVVGLPHNIVYGNQREAILSALDEKLSRYKVPVIVALDFFDPANPFQQTEDAVFGSRGFSAPFDPDRAIVGPPVPARLRDGALDRGGDDGRRARTRLEAVLPFTLRGTGDGTFEVRARIITNPAADRPLALREFSPIPRLVFTHQHGAQKRFHYLAEDGSRLSPEAIGAWNHVP